MAPRAAQPTPGAPIELRLKVRNRFYETILFGVALADVCEPIRSSRTVDESTDIAEKQESLFHNFLNKISQVCNNNKCGGDTVTSFVILVGLDNAQKHTEYRFASNQRNDAQLRDTKNFVVRLLDTIGTEQDSGAGSATLAQILLFNKSRVKAYLSSLAKQCGPCIRSLLGVLNPEESMEFLRDRIQALEETLTSVKSLLGQDDESYILACHRAAVAIQTIIEPTMAGLSMRMAREGHMAERTFWSELRHAATRFISYYRAVGTFRQALKLWPELFTDFTVTFIASSLPWTNVFKRTKDVSAHDIIGRMTSDHHKMAEYRAQAAHLEAVGGLNERLRIQAGRMKPIVHSEVLVLQSLVDDQIVGDINKFFNRYQYIGSSKPTCRLCWYYFEAHDSDVKVRDSHRNLYPSWRVPDVFTSQDVRKNERIMNKMNEQLRGEVFRSLSQRVALRRPHDSNSDRTYPTFLLNEAPQTPDSDNLLSALANMQIQDDGLPSTLAEGAGTLSDHATFPSSSSSSLEFGEYTSLALEQSDPPFSVSNDEEEEGDDDKGGASLV